MKIKNSQRISFRDQLRTIKHQSIKSELNSNGTQTAFHLAGTKVQRLLKSIDFLQGKKMNSKNLGHDGVVDLEEGEVLPGEDAGHLGRFLDYL